MTTARRTSPIPQLKCLSSAALCALHPISVMRCTNQGASYTAEDIEWACSAALPDTLQLSETEVICEGYASPDDPFVLRGSCGVEYRVQLTPRGRAQHPDLARAETRRSALGVAVFVAFVVLVVVLARCTAANEHVQRGPRGFRPGWGGGGGWGGDGWGGPPGSRGFPKEDEGPWKPGFWTGAAAGAAAGYAAGRGREGRGYRGADTRESTGYGSTRRR
ncbi:hypothetical protein TD95_003612 [Thielaviopsis punctulata]|uniref:Store-operated calcium entry-associated regulatory factor n=1 Tax=Thielaviopsis punctulata TaxID=72032 RepID=A0A0F4ZC33_9PEZI|nr:hypothetical protein TD95_003612 [Thielaviopsis punctulata]